MPSDQDVFAYLEKLKGGSADRYAAIKRHCESAAVRWEWTSSRRYHIEPFWFERHKIARGRVLKQQPQSAEQSCHYGFDAQDRLTVERSYSSFVGQYDELFFGYTNGIIEQHWYDHSHSKPIQHLKRAVVKDGQTQAIYWLGKNFTNITRFEYDGDRLVLCTSDKTVPGTPPQTDHDEYRLVYDADGLLRIDRSNRYETYGGFTSEQVVYRRKLKDAAAKKAAITERLYTLLLAESERALSNFKADHHDENCFGFVYTLTNDSCFVECAFGTEEALSEAAAKSLSKNPQQSPEILKARRQHLRWNPWDGWHFYQLGVPNEKAVLGAAEMPGFEAVLAEAFEYNLFEEYGDQTKILCLRVLESLDAAGRFGVGDERHKIAIGIAVGGWDNVFEETMAKVNPGAVVIRVRRQLREAAAAERL